MAALKLFAVLLVLIPVLLTKANGEKKQFVVYQTSDFEKAHNLKLFYNTV